MQKREEERDGAEGGAGAWDEVLQKDAPRPAREGFQVGKGRLPREVRAQSGGHGQYL